jgi:hypothetical protein
VQAMALIVDAIQCPVCLDVIYSRTTHDYHGCSCPNEEGITVDGGFCYMRVSYSSKINGNEIKHIRLELPVTKQELYDDWNKQIDKYGKIKIQN